MKYKWLIGILALVIMVSASLIIKKMTRSDSSGATAKNNAYAKQMGIQQCEGEGPVAFTHPPMKPEDVAIVIPYGLLAGGHVTPIDHMYFSPKEFHSPPDTYPVYAIADGTIATIGFRPAHSGEAANKNAVKKGDYRLDLYYNCTFYSYYDLITSLSPELAALVPTDTSEFWHKTVHIPVKAGQEIGRIGGQTLDWAVYNAEVTLPGFIVPEHYTDLEPWKIHTDYRSLDYFVEPYKTQFYDLLVRKVEPRIGKIDYDRDGKLIGNWFLEGTSGYSGIGEPGNGYWKGHLSIVPNHIDPTLWHVSIGDWKGVATQFAIEPSQDPAAIGPENGLIKYELRQSELYNGDTNQPWLSNEGPIANPKGRVTGEVKGTILLQLIEPRKLKVETFPDKPASTVSTFSSAAKMYER